MVIYFDAPRFDIRSSIFGRGYGSLTVTLLSHLWSTPMHWVLSFFFTKTIGAAHGLFDDLIMSWSAGSLFLPLALPGSGVLNGMGATL